MLRRATELGLEKLSELKPDDLKRALENAAALSERLPPDIHWSEEPALVFNLAKGMEKHS